MALLVTLLCRGTVLFYEVSLGNCHCGCDVHGMKGTVDMRGHRGQLAQMILVLSSRTALHLTVMHPAICISVRCVVSSWAASAKQCLGVHDRCQDIGTAIISGVQHWVEYPPCCIRKATLRSQPAKPTLAAARHLMLQTNCLIYSAAQVPHTAAAGALPTGGRHSYGAHQLCGRRNRARRHRHQVRGPVTIHQSCTYCEESMWWTSRIGKAVLHQMYQCHSVGTSPTVCELRLLWAARRAWGYKMVILIDS
jgi:hypothetical protein